MPDALPGELLEEALLRLAGWDVVVGERVAEVGERERAALGDRARGAHGGGQIAEQARHLGGRLQPALAVRRQAPADLVDGRLRARAGEDVVHDPPRGRGVADVVGRDHADAERLRLRQHVAVAVRLVGVEVALHLQVDAVAPEQVAQRRQIGARRRARQRGEPARVRGEQFGGRVDGIGLVLARSWRP